MKAAVARQYGGPEVLQIEQVAVPTVKNNEVLVEVVAASSTAADGFLRTGKPYISRLFVGLKRPKHPIVGTGFAGVVTQIGSDVSQFSVGDAVFGETTLGFSSNAEYVAVPEDGVILHKPESLSFSAACTYGDGPLTSLNFLQEIGKIQPNQTVLINGASGALGTAAVQIAKLKGAIVTAVCSTRNVKLVESLGADFVIDYTKHQFTQSASQYDIVFDTIGKSSYQQCKPILTPNGQYLSPVLKAQLLLDSICTSLFSKKKALFAATGMRSAKDLTQLTHQLVNWQQQGKLTTVIDRQFPLDKIQDAHTFIAAGRKRGNVVLNVKL